MDYANKHKQHYMKNFLNIFTNKKINTNKIPE